MTHRFATYEEAGIYAGAMRSEGYYAAILDEHMGFIYGPLAIGGFRVIVSDDPVEDEEPLVFAASPLDPVLDAIRLLVVAFVSLGIVILAVQFMKLPASYLADFAGLVLRCTFLAAVFCLLIPLVEPMTRALRDERSVFGMCVRGLVVLHVAVNLLGPPCAVFYLIWSEAHPQFYH